MTDSAQSVTESRRDNWFEEGQTATERLTAFAREHPGEIDPALMGFAKMVDREDGDR